MQSESKAFTLKVFIDRHSRESERVKANFPKLAVNEYKDPLKGSLTAL